MLFGLSKNAIVLALCAGLVGIVPQSLPFGGFSGQAKAQGQFTELAEAQAALARLGFDPGPADGQMGPRTRAALLSFQQLTNAPVSGMLNMGTAIALQELFSTTRPDGPSFDCAQARTMPERVICVNIDLATLDLELLTAFRGALDVGPADRLTQDQRNWLTVRNRCGSNAECLRDQMQGRIAELRQIAGMPTVQPGPELPRFSATFDTDPLPLQWLALDSGATNRDIAIPRQTIDQRTLLQRMYAGQDGADQLPATPEERIRHLVNYGTVLPLSAIRASFLAIDPSMSGAPRSVQQWLSQLDTAIASGMAASEFLGDRMRRAQWNDIITDAISDPFKTARLDDWIVTQWPSLLADMQIRDPVELTAVCYVPMPVYVVAQSAFVFDQNWVQNGCRGVDGRNPGLFRAFDQVEVRVELPGLRLPSTLPMPFDQAERFAAQYGPRGFLMTFPARATMRRDTDPRTRESAILRLERLGNLELRTPGAPLSQPAVLRFDEVEETTDVIPEDWFTARTPVTGPEIVNATDELPYLLVLAEGGEISDAYWYDLLDLRQRTEGLALRFLRDNPGTIWADINEWGPFFRGDLATRNTQDLQPEFREWTGQRAAALPRELIWGAGLGNLPNPSILPFQNTAYQDAGFNMRNLQTGTRVGAQSNLPDWVQSALDAGPGGDTRRVVMLGDRLVGLLPAPIEAYRFDAGPAAAARTADQNLVMQTHVELSDLRLETINGKDVVFANLRPTVSTISTYDFATAVTGPPIFEQDHQNVAAMDFGVVNAGDIPVPPAPEGYAGWEMLDLLRLAHLRNSIDTDLADKMMQRRFYGEKQNAVSDSVRFFDTLASLPDDPPTRETLREAFMEWQGRRAAALPATVRVRLNAPEVLQRGDPNGQGVEVFDRSPLHRLPSMDRGELAQFCGSPNMGRMAWQDMMTQAEALDGDARRGALACALYLWGRTAPDPQLFRALGDGQSDEFSSGPFCGWQSDAGPCQRVDWPDELDIGRTQTPLTHTHFRLDRVIDLAALPIGTQQISTFEIELRVTGARNLLRDTVTPIEQAQVAAQALLDGQSPSRAVGGAEGRPLNGQMILYTAEVVAMRSIDASTGAELMKFDLMQVPTIPMEQVVAILDAPSNTVATDTSGQTQGGTGAPENAISGAAGFDVLGLRLGMPIEAAEAIVREHMDVVWTFKADRTVQSAGAAGPPPAWSSGHLFVNDANREFIALYHEPLAPEIGLLGVVRWVFVSPQTVQPEVLGGALARRYGPPSHSMPMNEAISTGVMWSWSDPPDNGNCGFVVQRPQNDIWRIVDQDAPWGAPFPIADLSLPDLRTKININNFLDRTDIQPGWFCPPILSVRSSVSRANFQMPADLANAVVTVFYDERRAFEALKQIQAAGPQFGSDGGQDVELDIEF